MNRQPPTAVELDDDDLEQVRTTIWPEEQRPSRFVVSLLERVAGECMLDCVNDVLIGDPVPARGRVNLHTRLL